MNISVPSEKELQLASKKLEQRREKLLRQSRELEKSIEQVEKENTIVNHLLDLHDIYVKRGLVEDSTESKTELETIEELFFVLTGKNDNERRSNQES